MRPIPSARTTALILLAAWIALCAPAFAWAAGSQADSPAGAAAAPDSVPASPEAAALLARIASSLNQLETFEAGFVQTQQWVGSEDSPAWRGTLYLKRPNLFRLEYSQPAGHLQVSDGETVWTYVPENHEVLTAKLGAEQARGGDLLRYILDNGRARGRVERDAVDGTPARMVALRPPDGVGLSGVRLWARGDSADLLQYEITDSSGNTTLYRLTRTKKNPKLSDSLFRFTPPPGVPVVELGSP